MFDDARRCDVHREPVIPCSTVWRAMRRTSISVVPVDRAQIRTAHIDWRRWIRCPRIGWRWRERPQHAWRRRCLFARTWWHALPACISPFEPAAGICLSAGLGGGRPNAGACVKRQWREFEDGLPFIGAKRDPTLQNIGAWRSGALEAHVAKTGCAAASRRRRGPAGAS